ncbi:hypothetical protein [Paenibacillus sp. O199]|uniref:hypothetical protein n=1 Tax=Paenibacillus sp. O199 TaxID=1643925 RepID=UPI0007BFABAC|nr:hypothetical protein [Paenibacillus sp. O199]
MDRKMAENLMTANTDMGRAYRNYIMAGLTEAQIDEALGLTPKPQVVIVDDSEDQMTTVNEINADYGLYMGNLMLEALCNKELEVDTDIYFKAPDDYLDDVSEWGTLPIKSAAQEFLEQFYDPQGVESILNRYEWEV